MLDSRYPLLDFNLAVRARRAFAVRSLPRRRELTQRSLESVLAAVSHLRPGTSHRASGTGQFGKRSQSTIFGGLLVAGRTHLSAHEVS